MSLGGFMRNTKVSRTTTSTRTAPKVTATRASSTKTAAKVAAPVAASTRPVAKRGTPPRKIESASISTKENKVVKNIETKTQYTPDQKHAMICEAAYYIAERHGFNPDMAQWCWLEAEKEINAKLLM